MASEELKKAAKRFAEVIAIMSKNYVSATIVNGLQPIIDKTVATLTDDVKDKLGKKEEEKPDKLGDSKGAEQPDLFVVECDSLRIIYDWDNSYTAYNLICVRVGTKDDAFFTLGRKYTVAYRCLKTMHDKLKKEEALTPNLPPDCMHGTYCCCLTHKSDMGASERTMKSYMAELVKAYPKSKALPDHFYMGDKWEIQQRSKLIFDSAFESTRNEVIKGAYTTVIPPFDETEGMIQLLRVVARNEVVEKIRAHVPNIPVIKSHLERGASQSVLAAVDTAVGAGWPPIQNVINHVKEEVLEMLDKKADDVVEKIQPLLKKLLELIQSKLHKKEEKKEDESKDEKKKKTQIGDFVKNWKFDNTDIGKKFFDQLGKEDAKSALDHLHHHLNQAINEDVERRLLEGAKRLLGEKASMEVVQFVIEKLADQSTHMIKRFTTVAPLMTACKTFFDKRAETEKKLKETKTAEEMEKAIDEGSASMWSTLPHIGVQLFKDMENVKAQIQSELSNLGDTAVQPLVDAADSMFQEQMKAINSVRTKTVLKLKTQTNLAGNEGALTEALRSAFREFVFNSIHVLVQDSWTSVSAAIVQSAVAQVQAKFDETVWPTIQQGLAELQKLIPEQLGKMGLQLESIAQKICAFVIEKGTTWVVTKLVIKLEELLFNQAEKL